MNILFLETFSFGAEDMLSAMEELGFSIIVFSHEQIYKRQNTEFDLAFTNMIELKKPAFVFSFNFFPSVSKCCLTYNVPYLSYVYDSPLLSLFSCTVLNPCNYIFLFDSYMYERLHNGGISTVYYLPLATNSDRLDKIILTDQEQHLFSSEISFVGSMYNESHRLFEKLDDINPYTKGYLDSIMKAQLNISGYYLIEDLLTPQICKDLQNSCPYRPHPDGAESDAYVYANYFIARKLAEQERTHILSILSVQHECKLYTHYPTPDLPYTKNMGPIDHYEILPRICKCTKINLNITLRSIQSGIPMRAWDIMGAGGFLLSNYQADYDKLFTDGEDYVCYFDDNDLLCKVDYYLSHEKERVEIAENGHRKVQIYHTYLNRLIEMLRISGLLQKCRIDNYYKD